MLIALNALWAVVVTACVKRMIARGALRPRIARIRSKTCVSFFRANKAQLVRSGTYAASEIYVGNYPYLIVPMLFGLGAPPIILDTTFKVFRGGATIFGAVCDILVPRQTSALAERDGPTLVRATLMAAALCSIPAAHRLPHPLLRRRQTIRHPARQCGDHAAGDHADPDRAADRQSDADGHPQRAGAQRLLPRSGAHRHGRGGGDDRRRRLSPCSPISISCNSSRPMPRSTPAARSRRWC